MLEADLTSTRKDLYAANVRTKSLTSVIKDKSGKVQMLEEQLASQDDLLKVIPQALEERGGRGGGGEGAGTGGWGRGYAGLQRGSISLFSRPLTLSVCLLVSQKALFVHILVFLSLFAIFVYWLS